MLVAKKGTFLKKKKAPKISHPLFNIFLSVLHQNKASNNFLKRGQRPIAGCIKGVD